MAVYKIEDTKKPPVLYTGTLRWIYTNLFSTIGNAVLTVLVITLLFIVMPPLFDWFLFSADWTSTNTTDCRANSDGACWGFIFDKFNIFIYGLYPNDSYWRPNLVLLSVPILFFAIKMIKNTVKRRKAIMLVILLFPFFTFYILHGGLFLSIIDTDKWGGLFLTLIIATTGIVVSFPIGLMLALGRNSKMPAIKYLSIIYIEFIRGVPLISILFMASVVLPLFFSSGVEVDKLLRALVGITLFQTAYIAEIIRGGLQAIPKGQYEAADSMGLSFTQKMIFIILPQALKVSIPNLTGSFIALFKDTTLVLIIGLFDMLGVVKLAVSDANWIGMDIEGFVFVAIVFWIILYTMSRYSSKLESKLSTGYK